MEPPECPVCLNIFAGDSSVPRVLSCGHSTCEDCLSQLPNPFPNTIRCPSCTQLVKLPDRPSSLPKNIDLLRLSSALQSQPDLPRKVNDVKPLTLLSQVDQIDNSNLFVRNLWPREFYLSWRKWVLPEESVLVGVNSDGKDGFFPLCCGKIVKSVNSVNNVNNSYDRHVLRGNEEVSLVKVGVFRDESEKHEERERSSCNNASKFMYSNEAKIIKVLYSMKENERDELVLVLNASLKIKRAGRIFGFWCNEEDNCVFVVCERFRRGLLKSVGGLENGFLGKIEGGHDEKVSKMGAFGMIGMEICEAVKGLHVDGLVVGGLCLYCFALDEFSQVFLDFGEVFMMGRRVCRMLTGNVGLNEEEWKYVFICPEVLIELLRNDGIELGDGSLRYQVGHGSDVWSLACVLVWLLSGKPFAEEIHGYYDCLSSAVNDQRGCDFVDLYSGWKEKITAFLEDRLGSELMSLKDILCKCLDFDPGRRPLVIEVWKCIRTLIVTPQFDVFYYSEAELMRCVSGQCILLSSLCQSVMNAKKGRFRPVEGGFLEEDENGGKDAHLDGRSMVHGDVVNGLSSGHVKCIDLMAHLDCITGLAVGGGFLFSSSHDKLVNVWSLQDFSHTHSFRSHEHRVTAVIFVDEGEPLCISADSGGVICIWSARVPLETTPINVIYEQKDWRYSGIHALAVSGNGCLYTGSGDRLIKAWSLKDCSLICSMSGHKSVVSSLAVGSGILYSGSWDGTVRLWSLIDHNPLAVLGEDRPGSSGSVLSLAVGSNLLLVGHENGYITIWFDDLLLKSSKVHNGAVFSICKSGKWLFSGGWDKSISMQELSGDGSQVEAILTGSVCCNSVVTALLYWQGMLFVGQADKVVKVYCPGEG